MMIRSLVPVTVQRFSAIIDGRIFGNGMKHLHYNIRIYIYINVMAFISIAVRAFFVIFLNRAYIAKRGVTNGTA